MALDGRLLATGLRAGMSREEVSKQLGPKNIDLGWVEAGYHIVQWILRVEAGSRTAGAAIECHFDRQDVLLAWEPWGRWHVQRVSEEQLDRLPKRARLADVIAALCLPEEIEQTTESGGLLLRYTMPLKSKEHDSAFVELYFNRDSRMTRKWVYIK